jgi:hypothetical protein
MASYNLMKMADRARLRIDRSLELEAVMAGTWPRNIDDRMRWSKPTPELVAKMCEADIEYVDLLDEQIAAGEKPGWE